MKPTAMQRPPEKGGKVKDPPPPPPKYSSTVTVRTGGTERTHVHNGVRPVSSAPSLASQADDDLPELRGRDSAQRKHRSVIYVASPTQRTPLPVSPKVRAQDSLKTPPPVHHPRPNSTGNLEQAAEDRGVNGHSSAPCVTDLDFLSSLPDLPPDGLSTPPSARSDRASTLSDSSSLASHSPRDSGIEIQVPPASYDNASDYSAFSHPVPVPDQFDQRVVENYVEHTDLHSAHTTPDSGHTLPLDQEASHTGADAVCTVPDAGCSVPESGYTMPEGKEAAPPVPRKPALARPPHLSGISENGLLEEGGAELDVSSEVRGHSNGHDVSTTNGFSPSGLAQRTGGQSEAESEFPPETFHIHMLQPHSKGAASAVTSQEPTFAGRRDVRDPKSVQERQIVSAKGTVRGFKNRVRAGIATFHLDQPSSKICEEIDGHQGPNYRVQEIGRIVVYTTSMTVVRETYDRCKAACNILQTHMVRYEARDLYMSREHQRQLRERLDARGAVRLPQIFADGVHLGGAEDLEKLNESGELRKLLENFPKIQVRISCGQCGGYRWVPCGVCHGSKKSVHRNNFTEEFCALRCMSCNESGLQRCQMCLDQQE